MRVDRGQDEQGRHPDTHDTCCGTLEAGHCAQMATGINDLIAGNSIELEREGSLGSKARAHINTVLHGLPHTAGRVRGSGQVQHDSLD